MKSLTSLKEQLSQFLLALILKIFSREVEIEGRGKVRIFPMVWKGRLYIFGLEGFARFASIEFTKVHQARIVDSPEHPPGPQVELKSALPRPRIVHSILSHLPQAQTEGLMEHFRVMGERYDFILAYGGKRAEFDKIRHAQKIFIEDPNLRGPVFGHSYTGYFATLIDYLADKTPPDWIFIGDYDTIPLQRDYLDSVVAKAREHGCGFVAKCIRDVTHSNCFGVAEAAAIHRLGWMATDAANRNIRAYHTLGPAFLFSWACLLDTAKQLERLSGIYFEITIPTAAALSGHGMLSMDGSSDAWKSIRFRPVHEVADLERLQSEGVSLVHPIKDIDGFFQVAPRLQSRAAGKMRRSLTA